MPQDNSDYLDDYEDVSDDSCDYSYGCQCDGCNESDSDSEPDLYSYNYRPRPRFYGTGPLYLGVELEVETKDRARAMRAAADGFSDLVYLKQDGSLNHGFEVVTHPMGVDYAINRAPWETLREMRAASAFIVKENNGLHVHLSRAGFRCDSHAYTWMKLFYRNQGPITRIARRSTGQWASFSEWGRRAQKVTAKVSADYEAERQSQYAGKYQAINTMPAHTFELRIFASTLRPERVRGTLAFVAATVEYTRQLSASRVAKNDGWAWQSFSRWLRDDAQAQYQPAITYGESVCAF